MMDTTTPEKINLFSVREVHDYFWSVNRSMTVFVYATIIFSVLSVVGFFVDPRATAITGTPVWAKSAKFSIAIAIYAVTALWIFGYDTLRPRLSQFVLTASAWILGLELSFIYIQGFRGVPMHFNLATPFDAALFQIMGMSITIFWFVNALGIGVLVAQKLPDKAFAWSLRLGLIVALLGMMEGFLMTGPTAEQMAAMQAGTPGAGNMIGGHTVGAADGGPGLPFLGWSTTHGDLRIGHFVGLHGLQAIPLLGLFLMHRRESWLTASHRLALVVIGALGHTGLMVIVTWQALRAQPLLAPDGLTLGALLLLVATTATAILAVVSHARTSNGHLSTVDALS